MAAWPQRSPVRQLGHVAVRWAHPLPTMTRSSTLGLTGTDLAMGAGGMGSSAGAVQRAGAVLGVGRNVSRVCGGGRGFGCRPLPLPLPLPLPYTPTTTTTTATTTTTTDTTTTTATTTATTTTTPTTPTTPTPARRYRYASTATTAPRQPASTWGPIAAPMPSQMLPAESRIHGDSSMAARSSHRLLG